jgi:phenylalanine ammonia-lyase
VFVDGRTLSISAVTAVSRYNATVTLDDSPAVKARISSSRNVITSKVESGTSVYGVSTGFGGSADTRTDDPLLLGNALLQHQQSGVLPTSSKPLDVLPLLDPLHSTSMPEAWVRGAMLIRMNSLIRGHSGVRLELIEKMNELLRANITPVVPIRGSISASGGMLLTLELSDHLPFSYSRRSFAFVIYRRDIGRKPIYTCVRRACSLWCPQNLFIAESS